MSGCSGAQGAASAAQLLTRVQLPAAPRHPTLTPVGARPPSPPTLPAVYQAGRVGAARQEQWWAAGGRTAMLMAPLKQSQKQQQQGRGGGGGGGKRARTEAAGDKENARD